jgi:hypothetical protein
MYSGYVGYNNCSKENSGDQNVFLFLGISGLTVFLYHAFLFYKMSSFEE